MASVLVIDDTDDMTNPVIDYLVKTKHTVRKMAPEFAYTEGIDAFQPEIIIVNLQLNGTDGKEFHTRLIEKYPLIHVETMFDPEIYLPPASSPEGAKTSPEGSKTSPEGSKTSPEASESAGAGKMPHPTEKP
jgi:hypothetical protein